MTFKNKYEERTERVSLRLPTPLKNQIWQAARKERMSATDVIVTILTTHFAGKPPAPQWRKGTTKTKKEKPHETKDVFA